MNFDTGVEIHFMYGDMGMYAKSLEKRELILEGAARVFLRQGYAGTRMKDIVDECGISRGGLYFYFSSVEEIFEEVIRARNESNRKRMKQFFDESAGFAARVEDYFAFHKDRLLNMQRSLRPAMMGYYLSKRSEIDQEFMQGQFQNSKNIILDVLQYGAETGELKQDPEVMADHIVFLLEGLSSKAMTVGVDEAVVDAQLSLVKRVLLEDV